MEIVNTHKDLKSAVHHVLHYYDVFHFPLCLQDILGNVSMKCASSDVEDVLVAHLAAKNIFYYNGFYSIDSDIKKHVANRIRGNELATVKIPKAINRGKLIFQFPFVRFVGISGSLSKGFATASSDFDFFIITSKNRLWICRTILHLFKKTTFLFHKQHDFCMNYFIDFSQLELEEKNIYTAIELSSLIPVAGKNQFDTLVKLNHWKNNFLPNGYVPFYKNKSIVEGTNFLKKFLEWCFNPFGDTCNLWLMKLTDNRWRKKWKKKNYPDADYDLAFKTTLHHSKNHPDNYQKKILSKLKSS